METVIRERVDMMRSQRGLLAQELREAQKAGATIQQLMEWTGYSRRMIFYMLKEN
jgi:hypothetical protein